MLRESLVPWRLVQEPPQLAAHDSVRVRTAFPQLGLQPPQSLYVKAGLCGQQVVREVACSLVQAPPQLASQLSVRVTEPQVALQPP